MTTASRCFTVRPTAAPREGLSVLVIDRTVGEAEAVCAALRADGHVAEAHAYGEDLMKIIAELNPQAIALRMRRGGSARATRSLVSQAFSHIRLITFNGSTVSAVRRQLPRHWTDLYELSAARMPRAAGFPRAVREALELLLSA